MKKTLIKTSVRELVGFVLRSGDLVSGGFASPSRLVDGTRGHQKLQKMRPAGYQSEVAVSHLVQTESVDLEISGRIDGLLIDDDQVLIEEIKTTSADLDEGTPDNPVHWAQAKVYAHIFALDNDLDQITIQLTYAQLDSDRVEELLEVFTAEQLAIFFDDLVEGYLHWAKAYTLWCQERDESVRALKFPFAEYRKGQRHLAAAVYRTIAAEGRLFAQAPTGIGKTISTLFPAIKAIGEGHGRKIFYLTAKTSGRQVAEKAFDDMRQGGLKFKNLTLTARDKICFGAEAGQSCNPEECPFAQGYYDRVNGALEEAFSHQALTRQTIEQVARKHEVCPFEFSLDLSLWVDAVICDYNYVFDPKAYLRRFFENSGGQYSFLIDEAHNLVDRAREMFSADLSRLEVGGLRRRLKEEQPKLARTLQKIERNLGAVAKRCREDDKGNWVSPDLPTDLVDLVQNFLEIAETVLGRGGPIEHRDDLIDFYFRALGFTRIAELFDDHYVTCAETPGRDLYLRLYCLDPSKQIRAALKRGTAAVFFSATLTPLDYFRQVFGGDTEDQLLNLESPFPPENLKLLVAAHIGTTYKLRDQTYGEVAEAIAALSRQKRGNYLAFFPSYRYLEEVAECFCSAHPDIAVQIQQSGMSEAERQDFLDLFDADNQDTLVGFAVMGGIFGEGIDLVGERLVGAIVVGVGLPQICQERDLIKDYYNERETPGFEYAYTYPGMNRVMQAAGRVIRSDHDRGVVLLIDQRFGQNRYRRLFPPSWQGAYTMGNTTGIGQIVDQFWNHLETS